LDAIFLGRLFLAGDVFPAAYLAPPEIRRRRSLFRLRLLLVRMRTASKNNIHGQLFRLGIVTDEEVSDLFSRKGLRVLARLDLPSDERALLDRKLAVIADLNAHIAVLEEEIAADLKDDPRAEIVMSLPGVGKITAYTILAEIGELERFPNSRALAAYAGLLPLSRESAGKDFGRRTTAGCNRFLRWAMIEAVSGAVRKSARMKSLHARVKAKNKRQPGKARVAVARELIELVHLLLTKNETYREKRPPRPGSLAARRGTSRGGDQNMSAHLHRASHSPLSARPTKGQADL